MYRKLVYSNRKLKSNFIKSILKMKKKRALEKYFGRIIPPGFLIPFVILGVILISVLSVLEYRSRQNDYKRLLENQASLFVKTLANTSQNTLTAADKIEEEINDAMISNLELIEQFNQKIVLSSGLLRELLQLTKFDEIFVYDSENFLTQRASKDPEKRTRLPDFILRAVASGTNQRIFSFGDTERGEIGYIAAVTKRTDGGVLIGIVSSEQIQSFRRLFGFGYFLRQLQAGEGVEYVLLQNPETILAGSFGGYEISPFSEDEFLAESLTGDQVRTRILQYEKNRIFEAVAPFSFGDEPFGILRVGLSMREYEILNVQAKRRMLIMAGVLIVLGLMFLNFILTYRHRQLLSKDLAQLREYTNEILENLESGVITIGEDGNIQIINKFASRLLGKNYEELFNRHFTVLPQYIQNPVESCLKKDKDRERFLKHWHSLKTEKKWLSIKSSLLTLEDNSEACIVLIDDVTEEARLEEQIRRNERLIAMSKLASFVAHEIRNPLNSINLIINLLKKKYKPSGEIGEYNEYVTTVQNEISRINNIVEEFINFARPPETKPAPIRFPEFFSQINRLFQERLKTSDITFTYIVEEHKKFLGDFEQLKQVFINLIENAIDAIEPPGEIIVTGKTKDNMYEIQFRDTGKGIPEENLERVFDLYFSTKENGSGIGLAVVSQIISSHRGTIEVESKRGSGTNFIIRLPLEKSREKIDV